MNRCWPLTDALFIIDRQTDHCGVERAAPVAALFHGGNNQSRTGLVTTSAVVLTALAVTSTAVPTTVPVTDAAVPTTEQADKKSRGIIPRTYPMIRMTVPDAGWKFCSHPISRAIVDAP